ncbi:unnamed protein product, partial [marine sediment metagenome]
VAEGRRPPGLFNVYTSGSVQVCLDTIRQFPPFDAPTRMDELVSKLNLLPGVTLTSMDKYPFVPIQEIATQDALERFKDAFGFVVAQVRTAAAS